MRGHKGLTKGQSIFWHAMQQITAFFMVTCIMLLVFYSCTEKYSWNLFAPEDKFEDTEDFDYMLLDSLYEIVRFNVIKSQLETDGFYDGTKVININAYANRKEDAEGVTAYYYLEDLLKWEKYGITNVYEEMEVLDYVQQVASKGYVFEMYDGNINEEQYAILQNYLGEAIAEVILSYCNSDGADVVYSGMYADIEMAEYIGTELYDAVGINDFVYDYNREIYDFLTDAMLNGYGGVNHIFIDRDTNKLMVNVSRLDERYTTADGLYLKDIASNWEDYEMLCSLLFQAIYDLSNNYDEYLNFKEKYESSATNIAYTFKMTMLGENVIISNMPTMVEAKLDEYFKTNYGKYIIYKPQYMTYESNTGIIRETNLFAMLSNYEYAYPETAKVWLAVDTNYPVEDQFSDAASAYKAMHPFAYRIAAIVVIMALAWFVLFLYLTVMTGKRRNKGEEESVLTLHWFDAIYTEIFVLLGFIAFMVVYIVAKSIANSVSMSHIFATGVSRGGLALIGGVNGMLLSALVCLFWYSLIRRIKGHILWKKSFVYSFVVKMILKGAKGLEKLWFKIYDNGNIVLWCGLPLVGAMGFNLLAGAILCYAWHWGTYPMLWTLLLLVALIDAFIFYFWIRNRVKRKKIVEGIAKIKDGEIDYQVSTEGMHGENLELANAVNSIGEGIKVAVETTMKDERLKADLITNVSHDIKTPLTSIINYVDLLKREKIEEEPVKGYIEVLDAKSQRLKQLTDDLVEASKISSGNITLLMEKINLTELVHQTIGEFFEKFEQKDLAVVADSMHEPVHIEADSRRIWRVMENLFGNIYKYAMPGTRVYLDMTKNEELQQVVFSVKNISAQPLNIKADELTERFIRGDVSRSTEGSGLGLSIAKNLTELQKGKFEIYLDGDLFKVSLIFPIINS